MNVHAKVMIVDDRCARVGSANLSNRSMGLDTECDLVLDAELDPRLGAAIASLRNRLLAEHLDCDPQAVADALAGARLADRRRRGAARPRRARWRPCCRSRPDGRRRGRRAAAGPRSRRWTSPFSTAWPAIPSSRRPTSCWRCWFPRPAPARPPIAGRLGPGRSRRWSRWSRSGG